MMGVWRNWQTRTVEGRMGQPMEVRVLSRPPRKQMQGTTVFEVIDSRVLRGNPLGDPHLRRVPVYLPPSYTKTASKRYPVYYMLVGFTGRGESLTHRQAFTETLPDQLDRLIRTRKIREAIVVMPDCFTRYGGSQYLNSSATGRYEDHVVKEIVPHVDRAFRTKASPESRAVLGKSSGGYGAMILGMRHPGVFGHIACHSGDMYFDYVYRADFPKHLQIVSKFGGTAGFVRAWEKMPKRNVGAYFPAINILAMASCYSPNPDSRLGFDLPFDEKTGELIPAVWKRWLAWDPVHMLARYRKNLAKLKTRFIDCGTRDQYHLHWGARIFAKRAKEAGVPFRHEEFDDDHSSISYRYDRSMPFLSRAMK